MSILALDLGTSSVRGLILDNAAMPQPGALARRKVALAVDRDGSATLDPADYLAALIDCLDDLNAAGQLDGVELVATAAQWHSVLPLDASGSPIGPLMTWLDTRPSALPGAAHPSDADGFHQRTGTWWHRFYWTVRLPWLRRHCGGRPARFVGLPEYVLAGLLGAAPMSVSQASGTGMLDLVTMDWDAEAADLAAARPGELPELAAADWHGQLRAEFAHRWPALAGVPWSPPIGDGAASNVGSGCLDASRAAVTVGTSAAVRLVQDAAAGVPLPPLPDLLWRYRVDHTRIVTGRAYSAGGNLYSWANRELRLPQGAELEQALGLIEPGEGVPADPRFGGDRPPGRAPAGAGELRGLGFGTTAVDIFAGLMEGVCRQVAGDLGKLESMVEAPVTEVVLGGGALAASDWWRRAFGVVLAPRQVRYMPEPEVGAVGAALVALGRRDGPGPARDIGQTVDGDSASKLPASQPLYPS
ncbi:FGGY family carbohydrate kinase [Micromonospora sp. NBC_01813]|uniref:FGGY family carbohydrate kinase n=1 Tax=Micromonospora sp. NBC_01813 TaxID=2975988 RepID=UPI002DDAF086|nr:FGGY family carbohydrate kinase [Micromonospora sp. NBC_01813]WSA09992.1 FGGY family carbohydrate kinase [Micromonospora sp. NBC_01813]